MPTNAQLHSEFNGINHQQLAIKHGLSVQQVYAQLKQHNQQRNITEFTQGVTTLAANPHIYQSLPVCLRDLLTQEAHALGATDALVLLAQLHSDFQPTCSSTSADHQTQQTSKNPSESLKHQGVVQPLMTALCHWYAGKYQGFRSFFSH